jgi:pimeloyl-ACP methyl ester carboxylesterase
MGGRVCQWLGINHQERIGSLILVSYSKDFITKNIEYLSKFGRNTSTPEFAQKLHFMASESHDAWDLLSTIKCPTLIIHDSNNQINPTENSTVLAKIIPNSKKVIIDGGRHGFLTEFKEKCCEIIQDFIKENPLK